MTDGGAPGKRLLLACRRGEYRRRAATSGSQGQRPSWRRGRGCRRSCCCDYCESFNPSTTIGDIPNVRQVTVYGVLGRGGSGWSWSRAPDGTASMGCFEPELRRVFLPLTARSGVKGTFTGEITVHPVIALW
jgi:hypothetical protein